MKTKISTARAVLTALPLLVFSLILVAPKVEAEDYSGQLDINEPANSEPVPPSWGDSAFEWYYSSFIEPKWLANDEGLTLFHLASKEWEACGAKVVFKGLTTSPSIKKDKRNVMGWAELPPHIRALTFRQKIKNSSQLVEADILVNTLNNKIKNDSALLQKVVKHEFGHALGLFHPISCSDIMSSATECGDKIASPPPQHLTEGDLAQCRIRYPQNK